MTTYFETVYDQVTSQLGWLENQVTTYENLFSQKVALLAAAGLPTLPTGPVFADPGAQPASPLLNPTVPTAPIDPGTAFNLPAAPADPTAAASAAIDAIIAAIPTYSSQVPALAIPAAPAPLDTSGLPGAPTLGTVTLPTAPDTTLPSVGAMLPISIPAFTFPTLPTFTATAPQFTATAPAAVLAWSEPVYASEVYNDVFASVKLMLAGQSGLPAPVLQAMWDRAHARDDVAAMNALQTAFEAFAAKGFSMPPGMLAEQVNATIQESQLKANATSREIYVKEQETLIEQLNIAVEKGIALETLNQNLFNNIQNRRLEIEKTRIEQAIAIYNAQVSAFNAMTSAYATGAQVFQTVTNAALARVEAFKTQVEAQAAIGQLNEQTVRIYTAQLEGVRVKTDIYRTSMEAAKVQTDILRTQIESYRAQIEGYAARVQADKTRFEAYDIQVRGEGVKAQALEAESAAFAARVNAVATGGQLALGKIKSQIDVAQLSTSRFIALVQAEQARVQSQTEQFRGLIQKYSADISAYVSEIQRDTQIKQLDVTKTEASLRNAIALYEANIAKYNGDAQRVISVAQLNINALEAVAGYAAQLAAGAMSALHVGLQTSSNAGANDSTSTNYNYSY